MNFKWGTSPCIEYIIYIVKPPYNGSRNTRMKSPYNEK